TDESVCITWIVFRARGPGSEHLAQLVMGGPIEVAKQAAIRSACALWTSRLDEPLRAYGACGWKNLQNSNSVGELIDRARGVYEDIRPGAGGAAAYRNGRKVGTRERDAKDDVPFVDAKGKPVALSKLRDVAAMPALLATLDIVLDDCAIANAPL